jgi:hypothetical protein
MVWALIGAGAGMALGAYGAQKQKHALGDAQNWYNQQLGDYYGREQGSNREFAQQYADLDQNRLNAMQGALTDYMSPAYGRQAGDTATSDAALAQVRAGTQTPQMSGAATSWAAPIAQRGEAALGRQQNLAGDEQMLRRMGQSQSGALSDFGVQEQRFGRQHNSIRSMEAMRQAMLAQQLQRLNMDAQNKFDFAGQKGNDLMMIGGLAGMGGGALDSWSQRGGQAAQGNRVPTQPIRYSNAEWGGATPSVTIRNAP